MLIGSVFDGIRSWWEYVSVNVPEDVRDRTIEHAVLVLQSVGVAAVIAIVLGVAAHRWHVLRAPLLGIASVFLTIPALALFTIFIPLVGIGAAPAKIALVMYALLPILRNTVVGLDSIDPAVAESAQGLGMGPFQRLVRIELPLAWPVISTGIRISLLLSTGIAAIATLVGGGGLGDFIKEGLSRYPGALSAEKVWTGTVFTTALALVFDATFGLIRRFTTSRGIRK